MKEQILKLLAARPFASFAIEVAEDVAYAIPTADHIFVGRKVIFLEDDDGAVDIVPIAHIRRLKVASAST